MEIKREDNAFVNRDEEGNMLAEITFVQTDRENVVNANHTYVSPKLRGQGAAGQLLDTLVEEMEAEGKLIHPTCSYVVKKFNEEPEKYDHINATKQ